MGLISHVCVLIFLNTFHLSVHFAVTDISVHCVCDWASQFLLRCCNNLFEGHLGIGPKVVRCRLGAIYHFMPKKSTHDITICLAKHQGMETSKLAPRECYLHSENMNSAHSIDIYPLSIPKVCPMMEHHMYDVMCIIKLCMRVLNMVNENRCRDTTKIGFDDYAHSSTP